MLKDRKIEKFWDYPTITEYDSQNASERSERAGNFWIFNEKKLILKDRKNEKLSESPKKNEHHSQNASERSERAEIFGFSMKNLI